MRAHCKRRLHFRQWAVCVLFRRPGSTINASVARQICPFLVWQYWDMPCLLRIFITVLLVYPPLHRFLWDFLKNTTYKLNLQNWKKIKHSKMSINISLNVLILAENVDGPYRPRKYIGPIKMKLSKWDSSTYITRGLGVTIIDYCCTVISIMIWLFY